MSTGTGKRRCNLLSILQFTVLPAGEDEEKRRSETQPRIRQPCHKCSPPLQSKENVSTAPLFHMPYNLAAVSYDRGVLQETIMHLEILITRIFDGLRLLFHPVLVLPAKSKKHTQKRANLTNLRRSSFHEMVSLSLGQCTAIVALCLAQGCTHDQSSAHLNVPFLHRAMPCPYEHTFDAETYVINAKFHLRSAFRSASSVQEYWLCGPGAT